MSKQSGIAIGLAISPVFDLDAAGGGLPDGARITEAGDTRVTEAGDTRIIDS